MGKLFFAGRKSKKYLHVFLAVAPDERVQQQQDGGETTLPIASPHFIKVITSWKRIFDGSGSP